MSSTDKLTS